MAKAPCPTLTDYPNFHKDQDAKTLYDAMKGLGTDEQAIINVVSNRSNSQRQEILKQYQTSYGQDLIKDLKSDLSGNFEETVLALMCPSDVYDARCLRKAMKRLGTDEAALIDILCTKTNKEIQLIKETYKRDYQRDLEKDVKSETSGDFRKVLVGVCSGARDEGPADETLAEEDARALYKAGEGKLGTDEAEFQRILVARSPDHVRAVFNAYDRISKRTIEEAIKSEMSGNLEKSYLTIIAFIRDPTEFYVDLLYKAMKGLGTNDGRLIRTIVSRCEWDLKQIKAIYEMKYKKSLADAVKDDTSGHYCRLLLELIK